MTHASEKLRLILAGGDQVHPARGENHEKREKGDLESEKTDPPAHYPFQGRLRHSRIPMHCPGVRSGDLHSAVTHGQLPEQPQWHTLLNSRNVLKVHHAAAQRDAAQPQTSSAS